MILGLRLLPRAAAPTALSRCSCSCACGGRPRPPASRGRVAMAPSRRAPSRASRTAAGHVVLPGLLRRKLRLDGRALLASRAATCSARRHASPARSLVLRRGRALRSSSRAPRSPPALGHGVTVPRRTRGSASWQRLRAGRHDGRSRRRHAAGGATAVAHVRAARQASEPPAPRGIAASVPAAPARPDSGASPRRRREPGASSRARRGTARPATAALPKRRSGRGG